METIIYIALFGLLMIGVLTGVYNLLFASEGDINAMRIQQEGMFLNSKINWALSNASSVSVSPGGDTLTITRPDLGVQSPITISVTEGNMTLARAGNAALQLNNERLKVEDALFIYTESVNGRPASVSVNYKLGDKSFYFRTYLRE